MSGTSILCPQCGGENELPTGQRFSPCRYCDTSLYADRSGVVSYYRLPPLLDAEKARAALRRWMAGNDTVKDLDQKSEIETLEPLAFPMWLFRVQRASGESTHVQPAAALPIPMLLDLDIPAGKLEPYHGKTDGFEAVEATVPLETARDWLIQWVGEKAFREIALVRVPLWRCHFNFRETPYVALVDGSTGAVFASVYPEKSESPFYLVAGLGLVLFTVEGLVINNPIVKIMAYALTAVPLLGLAYWVARKV